MTAAYRHAQPFIAMWVLMPLTLLVTAIALWWGGDPNARLGIAIVAATTAALLAVFGRLEVQVHADRLRWRFGWLGLPRWQLPLDRIQRCELAKGSAKGAGIKGSRRAREYTAALSSPGVRFTLDDGRSIFIGSPEPERLRAFVEARLSTAQPERR